MPTIIFDENQQKAINLDNVDTIKPDQNGSDFHIVFEKQLPVGDSFLATTLDTWVYHNQRERDKVFWNIVHSYGYKA